ncbi:MAG TPA: hypothetical protein PLM22_11935 [Candidatus Sabulitectum sp.]|nr:hypothetical protein [Candidatus Sabulitectum sp.]HPF31452.1 hypothetical protein [Candidatus Sabulitectum sp.]HPJ29633.1 hypothetical protein [Candidatus Sabulitectum sp.]HPR23473.1 hypothetical protein [Candidatus Sabulitectum sp.]
MRLAIPLTITFVAGMIMILQFFVPATQSLGESLQEWYMIVASFAIFLGAMNLITVHVHKIRFRAKNWKYSPVTIAGFAAMVLTGLFMGIETGRPFDFMFTTMMVPMGATMFSLLAFFVASAAFRAFRASNWRATLLLASAFIVMLGRVPIGSMIWNRIPLVSEWIMQVPNLAGQRAVMIGAAMGMVATSLRMIFGIERSYLGGTD